MSKELTKQERLQKRLEFLHKNFKDTESRTFEWRIIYDGHPNSSRVVDLWLKVAGQDKFGRRGRFAHGVWLDTTGKHIREGIYAWRDFE